MNNQLDQFMQRAIDQARQGQGRTAPNPPVGAVVVQGERIVGEGFHPAAGQPHAEIFALQAAGELALGADLYVTLEPCCHHGRTGPCTDAIMRSGVARVFVGVQDPNPRVSGKGIAILRAAGVEVQTGLLEMECARLIAPFKKHTLTGLPYVVYKAAMTLDGQTATSGGDSKWISCAASRQLVHELRNQVDAVMVGAGTVLADNPQLTTRLDIDGKDPVRVVVDGSLSTSPGATVYQQKSLARTILVTALDHPEKALQPYREAGVECIQVARHGTGLDLYEALTALGQKDFQYVLLEGGASLAGSMLRAGLIDRMMIFVAPKMLGGVGSGLFAGLGRETIEQAYKLGDLQASQVDADILIEGEVLHVYRPD